MKGIMRNKKGFSLIELMAVIAILSIISLIVVPRLGNYTQKARISRAQSNLIILKNAIERYNIEHNTPLSGVLSKENLIKKTDADGAINTNGILGPYINKIPDEWDIADVTVEEIMKYDPNTITGITDGKVTPLPN